MAQILNQVGRYKAGVLSSGIKQNEKTQSWQCIIKFAILAAWDEASKAWVDWSDPAQVEPQEKTAYLNIIQKDGEPNKINCQNLAETFGWDGDFSKLEHLEQYNRIAQLTLQEHTYNDETSVIVKYINPENWQGFTVEPLAPTAIKNLNAQYGARLRALLPKKAAPTTAPAATRTPVPAKVGPRPPAKAAPPPAAAHIEYTPADLDIPEENVPF